MKNVLILSVLVLILCGLSFAQSTSAGLLPDLAQHQQDWHSAIGWVDARSLDFIVFGDKPAMHKHQLPGPALWAASVHGATGQVFGEVKLDGKRAFAAVEDGKVLWENPDLISQDVPEVSPTGKAVVIKGRDNRTGTDGLLLVENRGQTITQISRDGKNASWSSDETKIVYEDKGAIVIYDLALHKYQPVGAGTSPSWSPDGKHMIYRTVKNWFVFADPSGSVQRSLLDGKDVLTPLYWSPDSEYLMYLTKSKASGSLNCPDARDVVAYRLRDGQSAPVYQVCEGYPYWMLRWIRLPSNVPLA